MNRFPTWFTTEAGRTYADRHIPQGMREEDLSCLHWVTGDLGVHFVNEGWSLCYDCAERICGELQAKHPDAEIISDGGCWTGDEEECARFCHSCGEPLSVGYSGHAIDEEIELLVNVVWGPFEHLSFRRCLSAVFWEWGEQSRPDPAPPKTWAEEERLTSIINWNRRIVDVMRLAYWVCFGHYPEERLPINWGYWFD